MTELLKKLKENGVRMEIEYNRYPFRDILVKFCIDPGQVLPKCYSFEISLKVLESSGMTFEEMLDRNLDKFLNVTKSYDK